MVSPGTERVKRQERARKIPGKIIDSRHGNLEILMDWLAQARLGPIPLPYVAVVTLLPPWIFTSVGVADHSLLYTLCVIISVLLKGSLMSRWITYSYARFLHCSMILLLLCGVMMMEIWVIGESLRISVLPLLVLVPVSNVIGIFILTAGRLEEGKSSSQVIGIFSRSSAQEYNWLMAPLGSAGMVVPFCITNNNFPEFKSLISQCTFAILYHSKTRGRLNVTDVTDSLYDQELQYLSRTLGRGKVLVVLDDLEDSSDWVRDSILHSQITIRDQTLGLYIFTTEEKRDKERIRRRLQPILDTLICSSSHLMADLIAALILCTSWLLHVYQGVTLILSNIGGSLLLCKFLLPFNPSLLQARLLTLLMVTVMELLAVYWYYSSVRAVWTAAHSFVTLLFAVLSS
ncbi:uncharacterized protein [Pyxicephalus adspersus]